MSWPSPDGRRSGHPAYAEVTLGLLHGAQPDAFVVCREAGREELLGFPGHRTGGIEQIITPITEPGRVVSPAIRCVGISLNTSKLDESSARAAIEDLSQCHALPVCDQVRFGVDAIADTTRASAMMPSPNEVLTPSFRPARMQKLRWGNRVASRPCCLGRGMCASFGLPRIE